MGENVWRSEDEWPLKRAESVNYYLHSGGRANSLNGDGLLEPFIPLESFSEDFVVSCDRNCQGDVWFADVSISVVRPHCLENLDQGKPPQKWMGQRIYPLKQCGGLDVDEEWQIPIVEWWLRRHRFPVSEVADGAS